MNKLDKLFYFIGWGLFIILIIISILQGLHILTLTDINIPCSFKLVTGYVCPGCGGTHALCSLARGSFIQAFIDHAFVAMTFLFFAIYLIWNTIFKKIPAWHFHEYYIFIGLGILLIQWIIKLLI